MNNLLYTVTNLDIIKELKENGVKNFVYPLSFFCVGIPSTFSIEDIKEDNAYIFVNRVMDTITIDHLKKVLEKLPNNIKGIIFDDIGIVNLLKDLEITKILYLSHFATNYESINLLFKYVDDVIISTDITEEEIDDIIKNTDKKVSLFTFGLVPSFYSRRSLISSYNKHFKLNNELIMDANVMNKKFITIENEFGTIMYHYPYFNGLKLNQKDIHYYFYFPILLDNNKQIDLLNNDLSNIENDDGFLNNKTIYKLPPKNGGDK